MPKYVVETSDKSKGTAFALCLCFGWLGLHRFYVGRIFSGIFYMFSFGFFGLGWFFDTLSIALGSFRDNVGVPLRN